MDRSCLQIRNEQSLANKAASLPAQREPDLGNPNAGQPWDGDHSLLGLVGPEAAGQPIGKESRTDWSPKERISEVPQAQRKGPWPLADTRTSAALRPYTRRPLEDMGGTAPEQQLSISASTIEMNLQLRI